MNIIWSAVFDGMESVCVHRKTTQLLSLSEPTGDFAAAQVFKWWLEEDANGSWPSLTNWDDWCGGDELQCDAVVVIHEPAALAGTFQVEAVRTIQTSAYWATDNADAIEALAVIAARDAEAAQEGKE